MKIYLLRHGEALPAPVDAERTLSARGQQQANAIGKALQVREATVQTIYHSGILRAQQTAEIVATHLHSPPTEQLAHLRPEDPIKPMALQIATWINPTMLVGHLPYMMYLVEALTLGTVVDFNPATLVCLEGGGEKWCLQWVMHPQVD